MSICRSLAAMIRLRCQKALCGPGTPSFFAVHNQRLFLFYSAEAKQAFEADPDGNTMQADAKSACRQQDAGAVSFRQRNIWQHRRHCTRRRRTALSGCAPLARSEPVRHPASTPPHRRR